MQDNISEVVNQDLLNYERQFHNLIGCDIVSGVDSISPNLLPFIDYVTSTSRPAALSVQKHQAYVLYVIAINLLEYRKVYDDDITFYSRLYLPYIYYTISKHFHKFKQMLISVEKKVYSHINDKAATIIDFSLVLYNISPSIIKTDTQHIFFKSSFLEISPESVDELQDHYYNIFQYIYYNYIKMKTKGVISTDGLTEIKKSIISNKDSRYDIYEFGLRSYQIQKICTTSDTLDAISSNFEKLKSSVLSNYLLRILKIAYFPNIKDEKLLLLKVNSSEFNFASLEQTVPLVCKLLRSMHIASKSSRMSAIDREHVKTSVFMAIDNWMIRRMDANYARQISSKLAASISNSILTGVYIDPQTMDTIEFDTVIFSNQFKTFIDLILTKITGETL